MRRLRLERESSDFLSSIENSFSTTFFDFTFGGGGVSLTPALPRSLEYLAPSRIPLSPPR